jgi:TRAP-type C4-dicarboxylate transport system permease small subunit
MKQKMYKLSEFLETVGGIILLIVMGLVVINVLLRSLFDSPINGTYDYVSLLSSLVIGLALANCAVHKGHIAIDYFIMKFPVKIQASIDVLMGLISVLFLLIAAWQIGEYGYSIFTSGRKSPSVMISYYPFVYIVGIGVFFFALVVLMQTLESMRKVIKK